MRHDNGSASAPVRLETDPPLATIMLNRPRVLNAMNLELVRRLDAAIEDACSRRDVRVVVITGAGRAFSAGLDLDMFASSGMPDGFYDLQERALRRLELADQITVAAIRGHCLGGGLQIAIACDIRVCADDARLGLPAVDEGLFPGMAPYRLPRLIGLGPARRLLLSGATVGPDEGVRLGLVDHVVEAAAFDEGVRETLTPYLQAPRAAVAAAKSQLRDAFDVPFHVSYQRSVPLLRACLRSADVAAARARRAARPAEDTIAASVPGVD
jgi:enoyl-CoA hydratase/3-hydroxyacyl-CoA dehydrogenase